MLTFDFDAEALWTSRDPKNARRPGVLSQGRYGAKVGVPKILETPAEADLRGTYFIPGWTVAAPRDDRFHPNLPGRLVRDGAGGRGGLVRRSRNRRLTPQ